MSHVSSTVFNKINKLQVRFFQDPGECYYTVKVIKQKIHVKTRNIFNKNEAFWKINFYFSTTYKVTKHSASFSYCYKVARKIAPLLFKVVCI